MAKSNLKILHIDLETAPHLVMAWGLFNQTIRINQISEPGYTLCWAAGWDGSKKIEFRRRDDSDFLDRVWELLDEADAVCTFNGDRFDIPVINREFLEKGYTPPSPYRSIDLFRTVRSRFRFASNKLDFVCQQLGIGAKIQHKGQELWNECMEGDEKAWKTMERYNRMDVQLLPKLYRYLRPWIKEHPNLALYMDSDRPVCTNCGSAHVQSRGTEKTKTQAYRRFACVECGTWMRSRTNCTTNKENILTQV